MNILDFFPFFNELDVLELRLRELDRVVTRFVAIQAEETHAGTPKPIFLNPHDTRWAPWHGRLDTVILPRMPQAADRWAREQTTRRIMPDLLLQTAADDLVLMSDVDEIPNAQLIAELAPRVTHRRWVGFNAACYYYYLNLRTPRPHKCIALARAGRVRELGGQHFREKGYRSPIGPIDGGWHFSYLGGVEAIRTKLSAFAHAEFDTDEVKDPQRLAQCIAERRSFFPQHVGHGKPLHGGQFFQVPLHELPQDVQQHPEHYAHHLLPWESV